MDTKMTGETVAMSTDMLGCDLITPTSREQGKSMASLCKMTAQCQIGCIYYPVSGPIVVRPAGPFVPVSFHYAESLSIREPDGLWRPPRSL